MGDFVSSFFDNILNIMGERVLFVLELLFSWINLPSFPEVLTNSINKFLDLIFDNLSILGFFVRINTLKLAFFVIVAAFNFKYIYKIVMWIANKIPFLDID